MGRKPDGNIMTESEMIEYGKSKKATSKVYKGEVMQLTDDAISTIVSRGLSELEHADRQKIDMADADMVKEVSRGYLKSCADTATLPSVAGLARAMGVDRNTLYLWMKKRDTETGKWLLMCQDLFSDLLSDGALKNNVNPIVSIFLQKAQYGLRDNVTIDVNQVQYDDADYGTETGYKKRYANLIPE